MSCLRAKWCQVFRTPDGGLNVTRTRHNVTFFFLIFNLRTAAFKVYCAIWVRRSNFNHQACPRVSLWARSFRKFCLNADFHVIFRDLLHAVKLRRGTDGFTSPLKEGVLRILFALKIRRLRPGANPANLGTKGQHATSRPPKPH